MDVVGLLRFQFIFGFIAGIAVTLFLINFVIGKESKVKLQEK